MGKALAMPEARAKLAAVGAEPMHMSADEFAAFMSQEFAVTGEVINAAGIEPS
jgi:tripartite-type tricarboxylate transporter receptor subunit TctC